MGKKKKLMLLGGIRYLLPAIEAAHKMGCHVITVDFIPNNIAHQYSDEYHNVSILDKDAVLNLAIKLQIDGILSFAVDPGVVTAAFVAEKMGLPFTCSYKSACILQDKSKFRQFLLENGFNTPNAKGYNKAEEALNDTDYFNWPVIVKPVDSAGSKGVTKVDNRKDLLQAIHVACNNSQSGRFIVEDFLELDGYQSSADCFSVNGELVYADYSDQHFDKNAENPYTPAMEIWPSSMSGEHQKNLTNEIQRLLKLLKCGTGMYNIESRVCKDGKAYIMEISPRAGGNRIAELQRIGTGIDLIEAEVMKAISLPVKHIEMPHYDEIYVNYIVHSLYNGIFRGIKYSGNFKEEFVIEESLYQKEGTKVEAFKGANNALGSIFIKFNARDVAERHLRNIKKFVTVNIE